MPIVNSSQTIGKLGVEANKKSSALQTRYLLQMLQRCDYVSSKHTAFLTSSQQSTQTWQINTNLSNPLHSLIMISQFLNQINKFWIQFSCISGQGMDIIPLIGASYHQIHVFTENTF